MPDDAPVTELIRVEHDGPVARITLHRPDAGNSLTPDMRDRWLVVRREAIDKEELRELVFDAWRMVVPKKLASLSDDELRL